MKKETAQEVLDLAVDSGDRKRLVDFFTQFSMDMYKSDRKKAEELFQWITIDDYKDFKKDPEKTIKDLMKVPEYLQDVTTLISLEMEMTQKEALASGAIKKETKERKKKSQEDDTPEPSTKDAKAKTKTEKPYDPINKTDVSKLLEKLKSLDRSTSEARKIRVALRKLGHKGGANG